MDVDGFRLDAIKHLVENGFAQENTNETHEWLIDYFEFYKQIDPAAFVVGEAWTNTEQVVDYTGDEVDIAFAFDLAEAIIKTVNGPLPSPVITEMAELVENIPQGQFATFLTNHDQNRVMSQLRGDIGRAKTAAVILLTSPGVPFIYYGEEIGMSGTKPDEDIRRPMQWSAENKSAGMSDGFPWRPPAEDYLEVNLANQEGDPDSLFNHYRQLIHLRHKHPALQTGDWQLVDTGSQWLYAYIRLHEDEIILVLLNLHPRDLAVEDYVLTLEAGPLSGQVTAVSIFGLENPAGPMVNDNGGFIDYIPFDSLPPKGYAVIELIQP
jgi:glycosidase